MWKFHLLSLQLCAGGAKLDSGPSTPLPDTKLLLFVLERLQKYVFGVLGLCFALPCCGFYIQFDECFFLLGQNSFRKDTYGVFSEPVDPEEVSL